MATLAIYAMNKTSTQSFLRRLLHINRREGLAVAKLGWITNAPAFGVYVFSDAAQLLALQTYCVIDNNWHCYHAKKQVIWTLWGDTAAL